MLGLITYALAGRDFSPAIVFPSLALYNILRQPLLFLPRALSATADAKNAFARLQTTFHAQLMEDTGLPIDPSLNLALDVEDATFEWEQTLEEPKEGKTKSSKHGHGKPTKGPKPDAWNNNKSANTFTPQVQFSVRNLSLKIPRGKLYAMVGPVGSGKTSILSGLLGEMKRTGGTVRFGGKIAYCSQMAWIQNATVVSGPCYGAGLLLTKQYRETIFSSEENGTKRHIGAL
jgi:ATP-binding cassette, subfamily C (CFTR/MRP), member 1